MALKVYYKEDVLNVAKALYVSRENWTPSELNLLFAFMLAFGCVPDLSIPVSQQIADRVLLKHTQINAP